MPYEIGLDNLGGAPPLTQLILLETIASFFDPIDVTEKDVVDRWKLQDIR